MNQPTRKALLCVIMLALLLSGGSLTAIAAEDVYADRTVEIGRQLACPVCDGQTIADSNSAVAMEMMQSVETQVRAGRSNTEIFDYFRARYGDEVLIEPPREGINLALWWLPVAALLIGFAIVALYFRDSARLSKRGSRESDERDDAELERLADRVLRDPDTETT